MDKEDNEENKGRRQQPQRPRLVRRDGSGVPIEPLERRIPYDPRFPNTFVELRKRRLSQALDHPPRKIKRWMRETGARYDLTSGTWYVPVPRRPGEGQLKRPEEPLPALGWPLPPRRLSGPPGTPVQPPMDWPITREEQIAEWVKRLIEWLEGYERLPIEARDPTEDTASRLPATLVIMGGVVLRWGARVARAAVLWILLRLHP